MSLTFAVATKTLSFQDGLAALTNEVIWLIVVATFFARAFGKNTLRRVLYTGSHATPSAW